MRDIVDTFHLDRWRFELETAGDDVTPDAVNVWVSEQVDTPLLSIEGLGATTLRRALRPDHPLAQCMRELCVAHDQRIQVAVEDKARSKSEVRRRLLATSAQVKAEFAELDRRIRALPTSDFDRSRLPERVYTEPVLVRIFYFGETATPHIRNFARKWSRDADYRNAAQAGTTPWAIRNDIFVSLAAFMYWTSTSRWIQGPGRRQVVEFAGAEHRENLRALWHLCDHEFEHLLQDEHARRIAAGESFGCQGDVAWLRNAIATARAGVKVDRSP